MVEHFLSFASAAPIRSNSLHSRIYHLMRVAGKPIAYIRVPRLRGPRIGEAKLRARKDDAGRGKASVRQLPKLLRVCDRMSRRLRSDSKLSASLGRLRP